MRLIAGVLAIATVAACSDAFKPSISNVAGTYHLQTLMATDVIDTIDYVLAGATLTLTLDQNGTTTGSLFAPGSATGGSDTTYDLTGTWHLSGDVVTFDQTADTFLRDLPFIASENRLSGDQTFGGTRVRGVLSK